MYVEKEKKSGFSLVELSIVLVILGLLVGGVLTGQSLIRAAELRAVTTEYSRYITAVQSFRDKYFALPGDMNNATAFWGAAHATPATCNTTSSSTALTCNGDGNGQIAYGAPEMFRAWQHLANAGLIEGSYTGVDGPGTILGTNVPRSKLSSAGWSMTSGFSGDYPTLHFPTTSATSNKLTFGAVGTWTTVAVIKPEELWNIDTKLDDGLPPTGAVRTYTTSYLTNCTNGTTNTATYQLSNTSVACSIVFIPGF